MSSCGKRLAAEQERLVKLRELKHGLMNDLLSGRLRVAGGGLNYVGSG